jgi:hypothetical protein
MKKYDNNEPFVKADKYGRDKVCEKLKTIFNEKLTDVDVFYNQEDESRSDIIVSGWKNEKIFTYIIECKDRKFEHTKFDNDNINEDDRGYIIEEKKKKYLLDQIQYNFIPLYVNSFSDDYMVIWNFKKINWDECGKTGDKTFKEKTVVDSEKYIDNKQTLKLSQAQWIGKLN